MEVIEFAVLLTAQTLTMRQMASNLSNVNANGSRSAIAVLEPIPGSATRVELITIPSIM